MSNNTEESLEELISKGYIERYEYSDFKDIQLIGKGSFGSVFRVIWKNTTRYFALKSFDNDEQTLKQIVKELTLHRIVDIHENILRFYGITNVKPDMKEYALVLEYADSGTLDTYLNSHFYELDWNDKLRLALQLASAVECIHCRGVIHRDLHAKNVLIHQKNIKLVDFGLSKKIAETSSNSSKIFGVIPYIDPKNLNDKQYKLNEKSDIYSIGILMWQISSGHQPFDDQGYDVLLSIAIVKGLREEIVNETPKEYSNLYRECWNYEPNDRPNIQKVILTLKEVMSDKQDNTINESSLQSESNVNDDSSISSLGQYQSDSTPNNEIPDVNENLSISSSINFSGCCKSETGTSSQNSKSIQSSMVETITINSTNLTRNTIELKLEEDEFITLDEKAKEVITNLSEVKYLYALKLLFEDLKNEFSNQVLINSLVALADPTSFNLYYSRESVARLELHLRTLIVALERVCFSPICLTKELQDKVYNSLAKFAEIHLKMTQNDFKPNFDQVNNQDEKISEKRNYNIDFLLIHLRDTLLSLRDETWLRKIIRRTKELLKVALNITPGILPNDDNSAISILTQLHQDLNFKCHIPSYYIDWRTMLIIQYNIFKLSESSEKIINKKFGEMVLMEYLWNFLERELIDTADKVILDSQIKFEEILNKVAKTLRSTGSFLNDLSGNEPLALPHTLWFGILDLAQNLIQKSTQTATYGLCYYLAIESLNKSPSSFIQFKAIEVLLHLHNINNELFSMIELDFDQYIQKLDKNDSEKFKNLLMFVREKYLEDFKILSNTGKGKGKGKVLNQSLNLKKGQITKSNILDIIANEITCPVSHEPANQLCILKCQHVLSFNNLKKLKQKICPECREKIEDVDIRYLSQNTIYKNLYSQFFDAGHILPSIELEDSNQHDSDSDNSEVDLILAKKKKILKAFKLNSNISLSSILSRISKKQHPTYKNIIKELDEKNYEKAEYLCKEFLKTFPKSYSLRCILAYTYRCLNQYGEALFYLNEAIKLNEKNPIAFYICGEINFRLNDYNEAIENLEISIKYKAKINSNLYVILGNSYFFMYEYDESLENYKIALKNDPNNYLCLKYCAYIYEKKRKHSKTLEMLGILLSINEKDSLILCYYGEILSSTEKYDDAISYFTKANTIDPGNAHNLNKRAITYYILQEYDKALLDLDKVIQLDPLNKMAYYYKWLTYYEMKNISNAIVAFEKCNELDSWSYLHKVCKFIDGDFYTKLGILNTFNKFMYEAQKIYLISSLINLKNELYQFQENDPNSLSGHVLSFKDEEFNLTLPKFFVFYYDYCAIWKINIKKISSENCFVKFTMKIRRKYQYQHEVVEENAQEIIHTLEYEDLLKLEGLGWIEYKLPNIIVHGCYTQPEIETQPVIEANEFIDMQIDYVQFIEGDIVDYETNEEQTQTYFHRALSRVNKSLPNVPEVFKDIYFPRKEIENLLELKDIL